MRGRHSDTDIYWPGGSPYRPGTATTEARLIWRPLTEVSPVLDVAVADGSRVMPAFGTRIVFGTARLRPDPEGVVVGVAAADRRVVDRHPTEPTPGQGLQTMQGCIHLGRELWGHRGRGQYLKFPPSPQLAAEVGHAHGPVDLWDEPGVLLQWLFVRSLVHRRPRGTGLGIYPARLDGLPDDLHILGVESSHQTQESTTFESNNSQVASPAFLTVTTRPTGLYAKRPRNFKGFRDISTVRKQVGLLLKASRYW